MSEQYHPAIENVFETEGEDKGRIKNRVTAQALALTIDKSYDDSGAIGDVHKKELIDKATDRDLRNYLTYTAVEAEHPTFDSGKVEHRMAAEEGHVLALRGHVKELQSMAETGKKFRDQYDSLKK